MNTVVAQLLGEAKTVKTMTVGDLISELRYFPEDSPIYVATATGNHWRQVKAEAVRLVGSGDVKWSDYLDGMEVGSDIADVDDDGGIEPGAPGGPPLSPNYAVLINGGEQ